MSTEANDAHEDAEGAERHADLIHRADLVQVDTALHSWRDAGYDLTAAAGEICDNSIEAKATIIRIRPEVATTTELTTESARGKASKPKPRRHVERICFADNGVGIPLHILAAVLSMGFSTRYNQRAGLGRFGVGLKLASMSIARRVDVYTRHEPRGKVSHAYLDFDWVHAKEQKEIVAAEVEGFPEDCAELMRDAKGRPFPTGTLVIWSKIDRLSEGGRYGSSLDEKLKALRVYLARTYRRFLASGLAIEFDGKPVLLHDPLFLLENPRVSEKYPDAHGDVVQATTDKDAIEIDGHKVHVTVALVPEEFRWSQGGGGSVDREGREINFHIPDNEGRVSFLRNGREIYYEIVPKLFPGGVDKPDRYIGVEVRFPAQLDEYFQVRHVKRGAEPISKLREELREWLARPIEEARNQIRKRWGKTDSESRSVSTAHEGSVATVAAVDLTSPKGQAGQELGTVGETQIINDVINDLGINPETEPEKAEEVRRKVEEAPFNIVEGNWPGKEMFEISHLNGKAIVRINHRHPFIREIYDAVRNLAAKDAATVDPNDAMKVIRRVDTGLDLLILAYAKAENMHKHPDDAYGDLRSHWGQFTQAYVREALKNSKL